MSNLLHKIKHLSKENLLVIPTGVGSAFAKKNFNSSFIVAKEGKTLLVDLGVTVPYALSQKGIKVTDFDGYHFTHAHADHVGGVEELLLSSRYVTKQNLNICLTFDFAEHLWDNTLRGGIQWSEDPPLYLYDFATVQHPEFDGFLGKDKSIGTYHHHFLGMDLKLIKTPHCPAKNKSYLTNMWSNGLLVDNKIYISGDTQFTPELLESLTEVDLIFQDCQLFSPGDVHASYEELKTLSPAIKEKMYLYHYGDNFEDFTPELDGFKGFAKPWEIYIN